eukprot:CAMPEP_0170575394 /NCGR_PEP_ID=MMETSP0224-20130122/3840_1 /TAXON_ID=285029 /ORGANISM="Togula jolla, Strain CCCM 725" /LENGTH=145 /DNA_ID=CAMNT_0010898175 /DNA_START=772 /DNA_END=1209 /DNA_ORIENTATION=-
MPATGCYGDEGPRKRLLDLEGPLHGHHATHAPAHHADQLGDAEIGKHSPLCPHHVTDGHLRETTSVAFPGRGVYRRRARAAIATAQDVGAEDPVSVGIEGLARAQHWAPPGFYVGIAGERVEDNNAVAPRVVESTPGSVAYHDLL